MTTAFRTRSDPGLVAGALVLVGVRVVMAGILVHAGELSARPCASACACAKVGR